MTQAGRAGVEVSDLNTDQISTPVYYPTSLAKIDDHSSTVNQLYIPCKPHHASHPILSIEQQTCPLSNTRTSSEGKRSSSSADPQGSVRLSKLPGVTRCPYSSCIIGYAAAEAALENQAHIYIASSSIDRVNGAVSKLKDTIDGQSAGSVQGRPIDLTSDSSVKEVVDWVSNDTEGGKQSGIDHVIFTAGDSLMLGDLSQVNIDDCKCVSETRSIDVTYTRLIQARCRRWKSGSGVCFGSSSLLIPR